MFSLARAKLGAAAVPDCSFNLRLSTKLSAPLAATFPVSVVTPLTPRVVPILTAA